MALQEQEERLKRSVQEWNAWRNEHPEEEVDLSGSDLIGANLIRARLNGANLRKADLSRTDLRGAYLREANFSGANLGSANLQGAALYKADLSSADLRDANLWGAYLREANFSGANLRGAALVYANLYYTNLSNADLNGADLIDANLWGTTLSETNLSGAIFAFTSVAEVDLRLIKGLTEINHKGPSNIQLHTIQLPQDGSALYFLRGTGIPDEWIDFYRAQMMHPVQYSSIFISYSSKDEQLARRLHADLQAQGVRCWFAPHDMRPGTYMRKEIDQAIHLQDKMLLLLSEDAIASGWVEHEVEIALAREREHHREILFPIRLDAAIFQIRTGWAASLRKLRHIGDFTAWENAQTYQIAFERLLRDLKDTQS